MKKYILFFALLLLVSCAKKNDPLSQITEVNISVPTAVCDKCEATIKKALAGLDGVKGVDIDLEKKIAHVKYVAVQTNIETIERAITDAGYNANDKKRDPEAYANLPACCKKD